MFSSPDTSPSPPVSPTDEGDWPTILVVDDHQDVTRALHRLMQKHGLKAVCFNTGFEAIDYVRDNHVDAVVLDIHMPDMSGLLVSQKIRTFLGAEVPIIILSGDGSMETLNSLPLVGATHFFSKPIKAAQLIDHLRGLLT